MYTHRIHQFIAERLLHHHGLQLNGKGLDLYNRFMTNGSAIDELYNSLYAGHSNREKCLEQLIDAMVNAAKARPERLTAKDKLKLAKGNWYLSNDITGMSLYVDRFCGSLKNLEQRLDYFEELGVNLLHLMPVFESPINESDGGYAVSDFRKVDKRFGNIKDLRAVQLSMDEKDMYLMLDIVFNHTSNQHEWAKKAKAGESYYQDFFYMYDDRQLPDAFERTMPEIFPESAPGSFTYISECNKWVMTVFHNYQWDLNFTNPAVLVAMLENVFYSANLGVDILRIDAPAFIWKELGTTCQNLPQAHQLLRLLKQCVNVVCPGLALLAEAIVAPNEIMKYFGTGKYAAQECDFAYNATLMALQWDALATKDVRVLQKAVWEILPKPYGTTWITYTRCHDDIGLGYDDKYIAEAGFNAYEHRKFLKNYYGGDYVASPAVGALFGYNPKTHDARISGSLASLCGLEKALALGDADFIQASLNKIIMMQAFTFCVGGVPMLFYGDELAYINDYSYLNDAAKSYDNRWMHRPVIDWKKNELRKNKGTVEQKIFGQYQKLIQCRKKLVVFTDGNNLEWIQTQNNHVAGFIRRSESQVLFCFFNFNENETGISWYLFNEARQHGGLLYNHWKEQEIRVGRDDELLLLDGYGLCILEVIKQ